MMKRLNNTVLLEPDNVRARNSIIRNIAKWDVLPLFPMQNYDKPTNDSVTEWRRTQLLRYLKYHPETKPKEIMIQFSRHSPHPWPDVAQSNMSRILNSLKSRKSFSQETHTYTLSVDRSVTEETILSIATRWQRIPPPGVQIMKWRKIQICRYLKEFPDHGPSKIMLQLRSHHPNPQRGTARKHCRYFSSQKPSNRVLHRQPKLYQSVSKYYHICQLM